MTERISQKDVLTALELVKSAAVAAGVTEATNWHLDVGSKTYGRAWRIWLAKEGTTGHYTPMVHDFLGMTASEAHHTLRSYRSAFLAVTWARDES
jgi:hypothetical protein